MAAPRAESAGARSCTAAPGRTGTASASGGRAEPEARALALDRPPPDPDGEGDAGTPRDEACVLLDGEAAAVVGAAPDSTFDMQVRAAASLLRRMSDSGQRSSLVIHAAQRGRHRLGFGSGDWASVLGELAAVQATATRPLSEFLAEATRGPRPGRRGARLRDHGPRLGSAGRAGFGPAVGAMQPGRRVDRRGQLQRQEAHARHRPRGGGTAADTLGCGGGPDPFRRRHRQGALGAGAAAGGVPCLDRALND